MFNRAQTLPAERPRETTYNDGKPPASIAKRDPAQNKAHFKP
jgi:hypothetical protein